MGMSLCAKFLCKVVASSVGGWGARGREGADVESRIARAPRVALLPYHIHPMTDVHAIKTNDKCGLSNLVFFRCFRLQLGHLAHSFLGSE